MTPIQQLALTDNDWASFPVEHWDHVITYDDLIEDQDAAIQASLEGVE